MDRRNFLQGIAASAAGLEILSHSIDVSAQADAEAVRKHGRNVVPAAAVSVEGHILVAEFKNKTGSWKVYEDLRAREGSLTFISSSGEAGMLRTPAPAMMKPN